MRTFLFLLLLLLHPALVAAQPVVPEALADCGTMPAWGAPNRVEAAPAIDGLRVTWMPAADGPTDIAAFEIVRADTLAGPFLPVGLVNGGVNVFVDQTAVPGTIYFYRVRALAAANCTPWSDPARGLK